MKKKKTLLQYVEGKSVEEKFQNMRIDLDETEISYIKFIEYQSEFLKTFVNQKLILESNKFRDEKIQYQISLNINNLVNESISILNQSNLETRE